NEIRIGRPARLDDVGRRTRDEHGDRDRRAQRHQHEHQDDGRPRERDAAHAVSEKWCARSLKPKIAWHAAITAVSPKPGTMGAYAYHSGTASSIVVEPLWKELQPPSAARQESR